MTVLNINHIYLNKSTADLPGEVWKDIPGFEGSYRASSLGRVKSLDRTVPHPRLYKQFVKGRILSQSVHKNNNLVSGEPMIDLRVTLTIENRAYYFNTRRLIYKTFIDPRLDYSKDGLYVINIDNNGYNNSPENLKLVTKSEKQKRAVQRDRVLPYLKTADRSGWKKNYSTSKPVAQYDLEGNLIKKYPSIKEASRQVNLGEKAIIEVAKGLYKQWNGFVWRYL
ncbi:NUMOD4 domain-containing protein [Mucilaginibacter sp. SJ]|uniref:NUMOD4 domain-containing protein n=1 Tax=Mucilaginibacter sp. SJ TaxID=3029053 RepID=UPI0023A9DE32|nr:NUMOD4 domain-containing protein [Mucilaginibacter sp. SJ]WEA00679.1 NUMOD4 domain-containing protein [Mucilaginibacter sp. SJ]